jgi:hypothetical protein
MTHVALGDPEGPPHKGDELDCPQCRSVLLEAFRAPADVPEPASASRHPYLTRSRPDAGPLPVPAPGPLTRFGYTISVEARASEALGGSWAVVCTCGWLEHGRFTDPADVQVHRATALGLGLVHLAGHGPGGPAAPPPVPVHVTRVMTAPYARGVPGGNWYADCLCGWSANGIWTPRNTEKWAAGQAAAAAEAHKEGFHDHDHS